MNGSFYLGLAIGLLLVSIYVPTVLGATGLAFFGSFLLGVASINGVGYWLTKIIVEVEQVFNYHCFARGLLSGLSLGFFAFPAGEAVLVKVVRSIGKILPLTGRLPTVAECLSSS